MEMRNGGEEESIAITSSTSTNNTTKNKNLSPLCGSFVSVSSHHTPPPMADFNTSQYYVPFIEDDQQLQLQHPQTPLNLSPSSLTNAFNRLNLTNNIYSPPSPLINRPPPMVENPWTTPYDSAYLLELINRRNATIRQMEMMAQGLKPVVGGGGFGDYDSNNYPLFNNSHLLADPYSKLHYLNGDNNAGKCGCHTCQSNGFYPKDMSLSARRYTREDEYDYLNNMLRLQHQYPTLMNTPKFTSLDEVRGSMVLLAKDQHGCRFLQKKIEGGRKEDIDIIFSEIKDAISDLMVDQFGNYLVQKLIDMCNGDQRNDILVTLTRRERVLVKICCDMHGTRAIQKLLERLSNEQQQALFISALTPGTVVLITDINGHHVIQYCVKHFSIELKTYLLDAVAAHCVEIAMDRSGCCVLQLCVEHSHGEIRERLVAEITNNALVLAQDPYGNYVVQYLLGLKKPQYTAKLLRKLEGGFISLSMQKFSSNVVERCLKESSEDQATQIVKELISHPDILKLFHDAYGNYVIQSALAVSYKTRAYYSLLELVKKHDTSLRSHPYGKRILSKIDQLSK